MAQDRSTSDSQQELGLRVGELRRRAGLTQAELAARAGIGVSTLYRVERGSPVAGLRIMSRIADALSIGTSELYRREDVDTPAETSPDSVSSQRHEEILTRLEAIQTSIDELPEG